MGIDLVTSTMWAELAPWNALALRVILDRNHWAPLGTPRSGPGLSYDDRLDTHELTPSALVSGLEGARAMKALLASIDGSATTWSEPLPPPGAHQ